MGVLLLVLLYAASTRAAKTYTITTTWNGGAIDHKPVQLTLSPSSDQQYLELSIDAPFFNDPPSPPGPAGQAFYGLWNYEVVEAFFLNDDNQYLEVEVCPWGQHIVLMLSEQRVTIRHSLPLEVTTQRNPTTKSWTGLAKIPITYLPPTVTKFNAYAIHGSGKDRMYESLYPAPENASNPDFHALQYFQPINMSELLPDQPNAPMSELWEDALQGVFPYNITTTWNNLPVPNTPVQFTLQGFQAGVELNVTAPFYNDPAPNGTAGQPFYGLWDYEVVEMFFLNDNDEYLEVELGPWGEHLLLLLKGERNTIKHSLPLDFLVTERTMPIENKPGIWKGSAMIPPGYFPPNVTRMNAYAIHGVDDARDYQALHPAPNNDPDYPQPDFHRLSLFRAIDFEFQLSNNSEYSDVWLDAMASSSTTISPEFETEAAMETVTLLGLAETTPEPTPTPTTPPQQEEEPVNKTVFRQDAATIRRRHRPQPQRVLSTDIRGQRRDEDHLSTQTSRQGPRPVPTPQRVTSGIDQFQRRRLQQPGVQPPSQSLTEGQQITPQNEQESGQVFQDKRFSQHQQTEIPQKFSQGDPHFQEERFPQQTPQFQDQRQSSQGESPSHDQRFSQQAPNLQNERPREEHPEIPNQHFQQQVPDRRFQLQGQQAPNQRVQQEGQQVPDQRFQLQGQQVPDQRFQQQGQQVQDQRFQQQGQQVHDQRFQQQGQQVQDQRFQQQGQQVQDQRFQQQGQQVHDQRFQQQGQQVQDQRFQQQDQQVQDQRFQQQGQQVQDQRFQQQGQQVIDQTDSVLGSEPSLTTLPEIDLETDTTIPDVEAAMETLAEQTAALPPPHPVCFEPGLVVDQSRCYVFHECVLEDGVWQMYSWRCQRGHVYDPINVACVRGRCQRRRRGR
ncbi:uncharacterized protein LOC121873859 isoform X3 [Homarus americanus]|nr:uncharacterized protein LOC121873859 isoform X3 [Homarus americanus]